MIPAAMTGATRPTDVTDQIRRTRILATLGPATDAPGVLEALIRRQTDALARAGAAAAALIEEFRPATFRVAPGDDAIEVLDDEDRVRRAIAEISAIVRPDRYAGRSASI